MKVKDSFLKAADTGIDKTDYFLQNRWGVKNLERMNYLSNSLQNQRNSDSYELAQYLLVQKFLQIIFKDFTQGKIITRW